MNASYNLHIAYIYEIGGQRHLFVSLVACDTSNTWYGCMCVCIVVRPRCCFINLQAYSLRCALFIRCWKKKNESTLYFSHVKLRSTSISILFFALILMWMDLEISCLDESTCMCVLIEDTKKVKWHSLWSKVSHDNNLTLLNDNDGHFAIFISIKIGQKFFWPIFNHMRSFKMNVIYV